MLPESEIIRPLEINLFTIKYTKHYNTITGQQTAIHNDVYMSAGEIFYIAEMMLVFTSYLQYKYTR